MNQYLQKWELKEDKDGWYITCGCLAKDYRFYNGKRCFYCKKYFSKSKITKRDFLNKMLKNLWNR